MTRSKVSSKTILIAVLIALSSCVVFGHQEDTEIEDKEDNPIYQAITVVRFLAKAHPKAKQLISQIPFVKNPLLFLRDLTLIQVTAVAGFVFSGFLLLGTFFPQVFNAFGIKPPMTFRSLSDGVNELKNLNYEMVARSLKNLPELSFDVLNVKDGQCRTRAVCEVGEFLADSFPSAAWYIKSLNDNFPINDKYGVAIVKGIHQSSCAKVYSSCSQSPFKKFSMPLSFL